ncbi:MAG: bifunctional diguanylate cyclase/phosphodiesterase [Chloroflexota bacterium]
MQPDPPDSSTGFDELSEGRHGLRAVKVRLALTLIAVAILPLAALAPLARSVLDDPRIAQRERLNAQSARMATEVRRQLEEIRGTMLAVSAVPAISAALQPKATTKTLAAATQELDPVLDPPTGLVGAVALVNSAGAVQTQVGDTAADIASIPIPRPGASAFRLVPATGDQASRFVIAVGVPGGAEGRPAGSLIAAVPLPKMLVWMNATFATSSDRLSVLDLQSHELAGIQTTHRSPASSEPGIEFTADSAVLGTGIADLGIPGVPGLQLVGTAPLTIAVLSLPALATLLALACLLAAFVVLMGRRILAPAVALEEQRATFQKLYLSAREAALQDHLTGLGNHRAFQESLGRMVERSRRHGHRFAVVMLDIDEFKRVNDTRGHAIGDDLLIEVGSLIRAAIRASDAGFRVGGDEFALILSETDAEGAAITARRILGRGLEDRAIGDYRGPISFSAGVTACPEFGATRVELTGQADAALYRGKRAGRTAVSIYDPAQDRGHLDETMRSELSASISAVVESGSLTPVYQPIVHLETGRILGYEGLVRVDAASGFPHTGALFDAAEVAGRVLELDRAALDVVLRGAKEVPPLTLLSVNVSPRSFEAPEFSAAAFLAILRRHGVAPERILLELTERDVIRDPDRLRAAIHALQDAGIRVAADDVGAGNAGLRLLSQFRFDVVKIDLSLVQGGAGEVQTLSVLSTLVDLARRWGALTIAEGVETPEQLQMIRVLDIDAGQGYLLGRPSAEVADVDLDLDALAGTATPVRSPITSPRPTPARPSFDILPPAKVPANTAASMMAGALQSPFRQN